MHIITAKTDKSVSSLDDDPFTDDELDPHSKGLLQVTSVNQYSDPLDPYQMLTLDELKAFCKKKVSEGWHGAAQHARLHDLQRM